jgi:hypothetical protein
MNANGRARTPLRAATQAIHPMPVVADGDLRRKRWRAKKINYRPPELVKPSRTQFWVFPRTREIGQDTPASSSLGVSRELHLTLFPRGQPRRGLASQD